MLLSEDGRDACLCDFGHAERLDNGGQSLSGSKGKYILGLKAILEEAVVQNFKALNVVFLFHTRPEGFRDSHGP